MNIITTGVYGDTEKRFFQKLMDKNITLFIDIRLRRGMRGSKYKFVNSLYLQKKLSEMNIKYIHIKELAPTKEIRNLQKKQDSVEKTTKQKREELSQSFINAYNNEILSEYDFKSLLETIKDENAVLFCVEEKPCACHRSLVLSAIEEYSNEQSFNCFTYKNE